MRSHEFAGPTLRTATVHAVTGFPTPEEAARGSTPAKYVQVVATVIRGERAIVAQLMNDRAPFEVETAFCFREPDGTWVEGSSGNSTAGFLPTDDGMGTFVVWDEAPEGAAVARFLCRDSTRDVAVAKGCAVGVFDGITVEDEYTALFDGQRIVAWIDADGTETQLPHHDPPAWIRERMREWIEAIRRGEGLDDEGSQGWFEIHRVEEPGD